MSAVAIALDELTIDAGLNPRAGGINSAHVADLRAWLDANPKRDLPPAVVYRNGKAGHLLSEGFHRHAAYTAAGRKSMPCEVREGDRAAALLNAAGSNQSHGLKRTNEDKRLAVRLALAAAPDWTERQIAEHVGVSANFASEVRAAVAAELSSDDISDDEPEPESEDEERAGKPVKRGPKPKKADHAKHAARLLLKDHARTDDDVARELGCNAKTVALARKALQEKGRIPKNEDGPGSLAYELLAHPERSDADLAAEFGKTVGMVAKLRAKLVTVGKIKVMETEAEPEEIDPADAFVETVEKLCRDLDQIVARMKPLKADKLSHAMHLDSAIHQIEAARKTLWQGRPSEACPYCEVNETDGCKACAGTKRVKLEAAKRGREAVGGAAK